MDWLIQHPTDQYTHQKCRKYVHLCLHFVFVSSTRISGALLCQSPFRNSYPGSHGTHSSPFPTTARALVNREKNKCSELSFRPWRPLASNWCAFMQPTRVLRSTQAARRFLRSICIVMLSIRAYKSRPERTHVIPSDNLLVVHVYV